MGRALPALLAVILSLGGASARAADTYCVGGYEGVPINVVSACDTPEVLAMHRQWHHHNWVTDGTDCFVCFDENDNTCDTVFLKNRPDFQRMDWRECTRLYGERHERKRLVAHVIAGESVAPPPPPPPARLEARMERISPGPYTAGDKVTVEGAVRDEHGTLRRIVGGSFKVTDENGTTTEHPGTVRSDGTVEARISLPPSSSARIEFVPIAPPLAPGETLRAVASDPQELKVEVCAFRARLLQPGVHEALVSGQSTPLSAQLVDMAGQLVTPPPPGLSLTFTLQVEDESAQTLAADSALSATWTPPPSPQPREVRLSVGGRAGERVVCPAEEVTATVSDLGLGFDTTALPRVCFVGLPCKGTVRLVRPEPGAGRQRVDAILASPESVVRMVDTGTELYRGPSRTDDRYEFNATYSELKSASWSIVIQTPRGEIAMPAHDLKVRPPLELKLPASLDFGTVRAGTSLEKVCQKLDFSQSPGAEEHRWELRAEGLGDCQAQPGIRYVNMLGQVDSRSVVPSLTIEALDPKERRLDVCLDVPRCAAEVSPDSAVLHVVPLTPEFKHQAKVLRLHWKVEGRSFLSCHGFWVWPSLALLGLGVLLLGYTSPARFPPGAAIRVSGSERGIRQSAAILLRSCPGSGPGFYRDARLGLHGDGEVKGHIRNAAILLRASRGAGVILAGLGPLEQQDRRTLKWEPVAELSQGHVPSPSVLYRTGGTYFKVEL